MHENRHYTDPAPNTWHAIGLKSDVISLGKSLKAVVLKEMLVNKFYNCVS